ncbi:MAG: DUF1428 domain-containing protein [Patescibacteria group bacterium]|nr:DUF1428 domain-containing protein [Patescibacteria group bacterium]
MAKAKNKVGYVDGFVLIVPKKKIAAYKKMAKEAGQIWKKYGALDYKECMMEDPRPKGITFTFSKMTQAKVSETVWFSYIGYKSKAHRNQVDKKVMAEMMAKYEEKNKDMPMPFDMKRIAFAGFKVEVDSK